MAKLRAPPYSTSLLIRRCLPGVLVTGDKLWKGVLGLTRVEPHRATILYKWGLNDGRTREVLCHEIGHLVLERLGTGQERRCSPAARLVVVPEVEERCDLFGDELLVPLARLLEDVDGERLFPPRREAAAYAAWRNRVGWLAGHYRVTRACILRRLELLHDPSRLGLAPVLLPRSRRAARKVG